MKKILLCIFLFSCSITNAQTYHKLLGNTNSWHYILNMLGVIAPPPKGGPVVNAQNSFSIWADPDLFANIDTIYQSNNWKRFTDEYGYFTYGWIREDTIAQKIWFQTLNDTTVELLYDFSLQVTDSIYLTFPDNYTGSGYQTGWYAVDSIVNKNIVAGMRRHFYLNNYANPVNCASGQVEPLVWIESVGNPVHILYTHMSECGGWGPLNYGGLNYWWSFQIVCKSMNGTEVYHDYQISNGIQNGIISCYGTFDSCHYIMVCGGVDEQNLSNTFQLFPQPASEAFTLKYSASNKNIIDFFVADISGRIIQSNRSFSVSEGENELLLDAKDLENGLYFLVLKNQEDVQKLKFLVQH